MTMGPELMRRILRRSVRFGMLSVVRSPCPWVNFMVWLLRDSFHQPPFGCDRSRFVLPCRSVRVAVARQVAPSSLRGRIMPIHNWTRVEDGTFHHFHTTWITHLSEALNSGILPSPYYAL